MRCDRLTFMVGALLMKVTLVGGNGVVSLDGSVGDGSRPTHGWLATRP